jgi:hypothetical protein
LIAQDHLLRSCPARPTNGDPLDVLVGARASPTNIRSASGFPTPKTTCFRPSVASLQRGQVRTDLRLDRREPFRAASAIWITDPEAGSGEPEAGSREPGSRSWTPEAASCALSAERDHFTSRLSPVTPNSTAKRRCFRGLLPDVAHAAHNPRREQLLDAIEIFAASSVLSCSGCSTSPSARDETAALVSVSKPAPSRETSLATIRSTCLDASFCRARGRGIAGLGGEADEHGVRGRRGAPELGEDVGRAHERHRQRPSLLAIFAAAAPPRACSRRPRPPSPRRPRRARVRHRARHLRGAAHALDCTPAGGSSFVGPLTSTTCAPRRDASARIA